MLILIVGGLFVGVCLFLLWFFKLMSGWDDDSLGDSGATQVDR